LEFGHLFLKAQDREFPNSLFLLNFHEKILKFVDKVCFLSSGT